MANLLTGHVTNSLDECAPRTSFKVRNCHKFGISDITKALIKNRDCARNNIKLKSPAEKLIQQAVYKKLRNRVISELRKDNINLNNERVKNAADENEVWKVVKDVTKQNNPTSIVLEENGKIIDNEEEVANVFNDFFVQKIQKLHDNIDKNLVEDPYEKQSNCMTS